VTRKLEGGGGGEGGTQHDGSRPDGWSGGIGPEEGDDSVGWCWAERLLWLGSTLRNSKENRDGLPRLPGRIEGMNRKGI
jgi:hypothetical protein